MCQCNSPISETATPTSFHQRGVYENRPISNHFLLPLELLSGLDVDHALTIAGRVARDLRAPVHLVYLLEVARNLPLTTPLPEEEEAANSMMNLIQISVPSCGMSSRVSEPRPRSQRTSLDLMVWRALSCWVGCSPPPVREVPALVSLIDLDHPSLSPEYLPHPKLV